ncbi:UNVERIFIED_CONTAM: hypothetical protein K2H54_017052 [Gekko kuhli]
MELWQAGLARLVRDPLLCDLPAQVTPEEIASQVALEYGQAMTVRVRRADAPQEPMRGTCGGPTAWPLALRSWTTTARHCASTASGTGTRSAS